ncbi:hypothetical protein BH10BDE1_BH10BDE1_35040 [soil metagenome]
MKILALLSNNPAFQFVCAVACIASLAACSVEASSPNPYSTSPTTASKAVGMEGTWASDCVYDQGNYTRQTMSLHDNVVNVRVDVYFRSDCAGAPTFSAKADGTLLRYGSSFWVTGGHDVEVTMLQANGSAKSEKTVYLLESGILYTSDKRATTPGQWPTNVDRTRPFYYIGG